MLSDLTDIISKLGRNVNTLWYNSDMKKPQDLDRFQRFLGGTNHIPVVTLEKTPLAGSFSFQEFVTKLAPKLTYFVNKNA